jgi:D-ribose pyranose/furanose isomerase RbsD
MNKKTIALIILVVVIVGAYASYYAYASMVLIPEDLTVFKSELQPTSSPAIPESGITALENSANMVESYNALSMISQSERNIHAEEITSDNGNYSTVLKELKKNATANQEIALRYDLLLKGDVANEIRLIYANETVVIVDQMKNNTDKQAADLKSGDSKAYANDLREFAKLARQLNTNLEQAHTHLQNVVNKLGG